MYMFEYLMYIFEDQMCIFGYLKIPDIILSLVSTQKLDWTHTFGTYCTSTNPGKYPGLSLGIGHIQCLLTPSHLIFGRRINPLPAIWWTNQRRLVASQAAGVCCGTGAKRNVGAQLQRT